MSPEERERIYDLFLELRRLGPQERAKALDESGLSPEAREELARLLATEEQTLQQAFTFGQAVQELGRSIRDDEDQPDQTHPATIGPYTILSVLGRGGGGVVYKAERREPMHQLVAIKVVSPAGLSHRALLARFEHERQALASMSHPNIASIMDGGVTPEGTPYLVMELVEGLPITEFCDRHTYTLRQRLELFATVCDAVQYAHGRGVIHRDLKPGNVLVAMIEGEKQGSAPRPIVKVIDFGIAKFTQGPMAAKPALTLQGMPLGTVAYMSPEQAGLAGADIDAGTDVYSLGVMRPGPAADWRRST